MESPERIEVEGGTKVTITWRDRAIELDAATLRSACACAGCRSEQGAAKKAAVLSGPEPVTIDGAELKGAYAISFVFGPDGHSTGIFTWDFLRQIADGDGGPATPP